MVRARPLQPYVATLLLALPPAGPTLSSASDDRVAAGIWGGRHIGMDVTEGGASVEYDCGRGAIHQPLLLDNQGRFDVEGDYLQERPGHQREGEEHDRQDARYAGRIADRTMTLTVTLVDRKEPVGTFTLTYGRAPFLRKCL